MRLLLSCQRVVDYLLISFRVHHEARKGAAIIYFSSRVPKVDYAQTSSISDNRYRWRYSAWVADNDLSFIISAIQRFFIATATERQGFL